MATKKQNSQLHSYFISLIKKLKKDDETIGNLTIHYKHTNGKFELIIFDVPWKNGDVPYSPIIIDRTNGKIVGIMLPFNEVIRHLSSKENKEISALGVEWTGFAIKYRFNL